MKNVSVAAVLLVSLVATSARADEDFGRSGPYIGVGASRPLNLLEAFLDDDPVLTNIEFTNSWGVNARAGYHLASFVSLEAEYEWLGDFGARLGGVDLGVIRANAATANLRFIGPFGRFQPYLLLGAGAVFISTSDKFGLLAIDKTSFAGRVGLGMDVYVTPHFYLNFGAESLLSPAQVTLSAGPVSGSAHGVGAVSLQAGLGWRF
jgi:opacity protein-like surface antigen